jgi:signal transduction histidine kinase
LTSVNLLLSSLSEKELDYDKRLRTVYQLKRLSARIDWLIEALLKISRIDAGTVTFDKKQITAKALTDSAAQPLAAALELRGQSLEIKGEETVFECDVGWTGEAVSNILKNCMEHNPDGAKITVIASRTNIYTELVIEDEGSGFEENDLPRIFERFYKGKKDGAEGFGIGLSLARMIVCGQGGALFAENRKEGGARFVIRFYFATV